VKNFALIPGLFLPNHPGKKSEEYQESGNEHVEQSVRHPNMERIDKKNEQDQKNDRDYYFRCVMNIFSTETRKKEAIFRARQTEGV
jgi:hypothetical protein